MGKQRKSRVTDIIYIIVIIILISLIIKIYQIYKKNNFNEFTKAVYTQNVSEFSRDKEIKYSDVESYKINSQDFNDAMFFKNISVEPNTPYRVTCMVKVKNVKTEKSNSNGGAQICISDTLERSKAVKGTAEWQKLEFIFDSKNRNNVDIGFRLGGNDDNCSGTAWFSDFTIEAGVENTSTNWNFACFILKNVDINNDGLKMKTQMSVADINDMELNMSRFKESCQSLSQNRMTVSYDIIEINEPLHSLSYDNEYGYYIDANDVEEMIDTYIQKSEYDHIFVCAKLGDIVNNTHDNEWIGLGSMDYYGIGFSNIRLPDENNNYIYKYNSAINTFPEEVFIHEFLHTLERNAKENSYERPNLHDNEKYGYENKKKEGLKQWYRDYMMCNINYNGKYIGLPNEVYKTKPYHSSDFKYSYKLQEFKEPKNIIDDIRNIFVSFINVLNDKTIIKKDNKENVEI